MQLEIEALSPIRKRVQATVAVRQVDSDFSRAFNRVAKGARLPGFRRGKVPMSHLRKRYGAQVTADVTESLVQAAWSHAIDEHGLRPVAAPQVDAGTAKQGTEFSVTFTAEVFPDIEVKPYDQLSVERVQWIAGDAVVDHEIEHVREQVATYEPISDRDVAEDGDMAVIDFEGFVNDEAFAGGKGEDFDLLLGSGRFIPGFEEQIVGQSVGSEFDVNVDFPEDYQAEHLAGQAARFACSLKGLKVKVIPEVGPDLAEKLGEENMDAVRNTVRERIVAEHSRATDDEAKDALKAAIGASYTDLELPPTLFEAMLRDKKAEQTQAIQAKIKEGKTFDEAREEVETGDLEAEVSAAARTDLVIEAIAEKEGVDVSEHEVTMFVEQLARSMGQYGPQIRAMYRDRNQRAGLRRRMAQDKVLDFLLDNADVKVVEKDVPEHDHGDDQAADGHDHADHEHHDHD